MHWFDILVIVVVSVAVLAVIGVAIYKKANGKGGCDCGCEGCPHNCACKNKKQGKTK